MAPLLQATEATSTAGLTTQEPEAPSDLLFAGQWGIQPDSNIGPTTARDGRERECHVLLRLKQNTFITADNTHTLPKLILLGFQALIQMLRSRRTPCTVTLWWICVEFLDSIPPITAITDYRLQMPHYPAHQWQTFTASGVKKVVYTCLNS